MRKLNENKKYKGEFSVTHGMGTTLFEISVEDKLSGARFVEVRVDAKDLMLALTGQSNVRCEFELRGLSVLGKRHEAKRVIIPEITTHLNDGKFLEMINSVRPALEADGWKMDEQRHFNMHMLRGTWDKYPIGYEVILRRYVEVE